MKTLELLKPAIRPLLNLLFVLACLVVLWLLHPRGLRREPPGGPQAERRPRLPGQRRRRGRQPLRRPHPLWQTLLDAGIGFVAGLAAATVIATATYLSRGIEAATMPVAMIVRTVPLVALAPIITLVFGNGFATVAVMSGIVVFFPALVTITYGLRSVTAADERRRPRLRRLDLGRAASGRLPDRACPSVFAAIRISVPGAITGALIAEFYTTPDSVGKAINQALALYQYDLVWALLVVVTVVSVILYMVAQLCESLVLSRFGLSADR